MKKITALFFLFFLCICTKQKKIINPVFKESGYLTTTSYCYITFQNKKITTKNFEKYFEKETILSMKPYIEEIYKNKMQEIETYTFTPDTHTNNLILLENLYKNSLKKNGIVKEIAKIEIYGVPIKEIKMLCNTYDFSYIDKKDYEIKIRNK